MGACNSKESVAVARSGIHPTTSSSGIKNEKVPPAHISSGSNLPSTETPPPPAGAEGGKGSEISQQPSSSKQPHDETEATVLSEATQPPVADQSAMEEIRPLKASGDTRTTAMKKKGYSSGGSSSDSLEKNRPTSSIDPHLNLWRAELSADGILKQSVVRIETDFGRPIEEVYDGVYDGRVLGSGVEGTVRLIKHKDTGVEFAVKCLNLGLLRSEAGMQMLRDEIFIMTQLDHPNIVRLEEVYEGYSEIYLVMELCRGGDLFDRLDAQPEYHYSESQCARLVKHMLSAVRYLHSKGVIHRDLKLENFLFSSESKESELKLIDFGLSKHFQAGEVHHESVGTPYTVAPEIINGDYDEKCDMWAMGVIVYLLLSGETPFGGIDGEPLMSVRERILRGTVTFEPPEIWETVSDSGKSFVKRLLEIDPTKRPTAREAQLDPWIQEYGKKDAKDEQRLSARTADALLEFKGYSDMRKLLYEVLSFTLLPEQIEHLRNEFMKIDTDGDGEIAYSELRDVLLHNAEAGHLGGLTDVEVEDIFNALRVRKCDTVIHWHEFIAACSSQIAYDERNLKLAFDRLDYDRKGFLSFDDLMEVLGSADAEEEMREAWADAVHQCHCPLGKISYDTFLMIIKGQGSKDSVQRSASTRKLMDPPHSPLLGAVPEGEMSPQPRRATFAKFEGGETLPFDLKLPGLDLQEDATLSTKPQTQKMDDDSLSKDLLAGITPVPRPQHKRTRSRSLGETPLDERPPWCQEEFVLKSRKASRRSSGFAPPTAPIEELEALVRDNTKSSMHVNRALYRKNIETRTAILEASKEFDKKRQERLRKMRPGGTRTRAGSILVMKRGTRATPALVDERESGRESLLEEDSLREKEEIQAMEVATKRGGRIPRRKREKTFSDISGMLR